MKKLRFLLSLLIVIVLPAATVYADRTDDSTGSDTPEWLNYLGSELQESSDHLMKTGEDVDDIYSELYWKSIADTFPERFDLRERGTVTSVKNQSPWGTCWSFAAVASSETSILNSLGLTAEEYKEKYGEDIDLSEKHLAWFTANALPEIDEYDEGKYPYDPGQAGEGLHLLEGEDVQPLNCGGNYYLSTTTLAGGIGILKEKYAPYADSNGELDNTGDWSLPEEQRFSVSYELKDANVLPAPATFDKKGNYVYRPAATEAIKSELLAGRAVGICFRADQSRPETTKEEKREELREKLKDNTAVTDDEKAWYIDIRAGFIDTADLSDDELKNAVAIRLKVNSMPEDTYDLDSFDHDQLSKILLSQYFGYSYEDIVKNESKNTYMSFIGSDPVIYAQYTYDNVPPNHCVTVVGWDDTFAAGNWPEGRRPPGDGAWIAKNSWGEEWGNDGYFMLSYYDMSICGVCSFEYVVDEDVLSIGYLSILGYDFMPAEIISSTLFDDPVYTSNIFQAEEDSVLQYISAMTGDMDTTVTASVYLLNEDAKTPADGVLLGSITDTFRFAGYHRLDLTDNLVLPEGTRIGVVILESVPVEDGVKYALVNTGSFNQTGVETYNKNQEDDDRKLMRYAKGIVNPGESFVCYENGKWMDWSEAISVFGNMGSNKNVAYDNLPIKAYLYPQDQVEKAHDLSNRIPVTGGEAAICPEDGYLLLDIVKQ